MPGEPLFEIAASRLTKPPVVSILCPSFNHGRYVDECLRTAVEQTFREWELLVLDDGSSDDTVARAREYALQDGRIAVYSRPHQGPEGLGDLYNWGLARARGEYVAILEGDDYWPAEKLEVQIAAMRPEAALSFGRCTVVSASGRPLSTPIKPESPAVLENRPIGTALEPFLATRNFVDAVTAVVRTRALEEIGGFQTTHGMVQVDFPTWFEMAMHYPFQYIPRVLGYWRRHATSITTTRMEQMRRSKVAFMEEAIGRRGRALPAGASMTTEQALARLSADVTAFEAAWAAARCHLLLGEYGAARRGFASCVREARSLGDVAASSVGLSSALLRYDLLVHARKAHDWIRHQRGVRRDRHVVEHEHAGPTMRGR